MPQQVQLTGEGFPTDEQQPPTELRTARTELSLPPSLKATLVRMCTANGVSINEVIVRYLQRGLGAGALTTIVEDARRTQKGHRVRGTRPKEIQAA